MDSDLLEICMSVLLDFLKKDVEKTESTLRDHFIERLGTDSVFDGIIKKCPFCGGEASLSIEEVGSHDCPAVCCDQCNLSIYDEESLENVIKKWNTRVK